MAFWIVPVCALSSQVEKRPLAHNGYSRPYLVHKPAALDAHPPVVFMLGGAGSTAESTSREFGWVEEADKDRFMVVFPEPLAAHPDKPFSLADNITYWENGVKAFRSHRILPGGLPVDDDGYLMAVLSDVLRRDHTDRSRVYFAGFSSGSGMAQLMAALHSKAIAAVAGVATPLMDSPAKLARPVPVLYIHGDDDDQLVGLGPYSPHFATTPHGSWVTWGYLNGCQTQTASKTEWGTEFSWQGCRNNVRVIADFVAHLGHEWPGNVNSRWNETHRPESPLDFTEMAWRFFAAAAASKR